MGKEKLTKQPEIIAAIISVIGTIAGTLLISILLGFLEGRIGLGTVAGVVTLLLLIAIWMLLAFRWGVRVAGGAAAVMVIVGSVLFLIVAAARLLPFGAPTPTSIAAASSPTPQPMPTPTPAPLPATSTPSPAEEARPLIAGECRIAYEQEGEIYVRNCDGSGVYRVTNHPAEDGSPAWSPDGQRIVFYSQRDGQAQEEWRPASLYIVDADGSNLTWLTHTEDNDHGPSWSPDGSRIAFHRNCILAVINSDGSNPRVILKQSDEECVENPAWSPDGQRLAFVCGRWGSEGDFDSFTAWVVKADGTGTVKLDEFQGRNAVPAWSSDGSQVAVKVGKAEGGEYRLMMNADGSGEAVEVESIPESWFPWHWPQWGGEALMPTPTPLGRIVYHNDWTDNNEIYVANSDGSGEQRLTDHPADDSFPAWSPDGKRIVFGSSRDGQPTPDGSNTSSIYIMDADGSNLTRVTDIESNDKLPTWSPDGSRIAFHKRGDLGVINVDGSNLVRVVTGREDMSLDIPCWSPDSRRIAFKSRVPPEGPCPCQHDIYVVNDDGSGLLKLATFTSEEDGTPEDYAVWSPDGSQVAFEIYLDGQSRYYSVKSDGSGEPVEVESISQSWYPWYYPQWQGQ